MVGGAGKASTEIGSVAAVSPSLTQALLFHPPADIVRHEHRHASADQRQGHLLGEVPAAADDPLSSVAPSVVEAWPPPLKWGDKLEIVS
jgi:hypothetical protein